MDDVAFIKKLSTPGYKIDKPKLAVQATIVKALWRLCHTMDTIGNELTSLNEKIDKIIIEQSTDAKRTIIK